VLAMVVGMGLFEWAERRQTRAAPAAAPAPFEGDA